MATKKLGSTKRTDNLLITSVTLSSEVAGILGVANGGTGQSTFTDGQILVGITSGNTLSKVSVSGDATLGNTGVLTIANNAVTDAKLRSSAALSVIGRASNTTGNVADIVAANDGEVLRRSGTSVGFGTIATAGIGDAQITYAKIQNVAASRLLGNSSGSAAAPAEIALAGSLAFASGSLQLSGDASSPGNSKYYGTNGSGTKGFFDLPSGASGANPTASIGLSATNGVATTFMRSDAAPALDQAVTPTWTGAHTHNVGTTPSDAITLTIAPIGSAGTRDSHSILLRGASDNGSAHTIDWRIYNNVTSNAGASNFTISNRVDANSYTPQLTLSDAGILGVATATNSPEYQIGTFKTISRNTADLRIGEGSFWTTAGWYTGGVARISLDNAGNVGIGTATFGASAAKVLAFSNGTAPSAGVSGVSQLYSKNNGSSVASLYLMRGDGSEVDLADRAIANTTGTLAVNRGGTGVTTTPSNGQLLIGNGSGYSVAAITPTTNQVNVTNGTGTITLSLPQSIHTAATPQFAALGLGVAAPSAGILLTEQSAPSTPATNGLHLYAKNGEGNVSGLFAKSDNGREVAIAMPGQYALQFVDTNNHHVNHGIFWPKDTNLSRTFFWEAWVKPDATGGYIISEGFGGLHALLFGTAGIGVGTYNQITGNVYDGSSALSFGSDDGAISGEWAHYAVGSDGNKIVTYVNGVPSGAVAYSHTIRRSQQGTMFVGGSGHSNYGGLIAMIRGFEGNNPLIGTFDSANRILISFRPETRLAGQANQRGYSADEIYPAFLADYTSPATVIPDHSPTGYNGGKHPGSLWSTTTVGDAGVNSGFGKNVVPSKYPLPKFVPDFSAPYAQVDSVPALPTSATLTPPSTPSGALIFDSFSRADSTFAFDNATPTLGSTEAGSLGVRAWDNNTPQTIFTVTATGGTFTITYAGQTTSAQAFNVSASGLQTALEALSTIGAGKVYVSSPTAGTYKILLSALLGQQSSNYVVNTGSLTGGSASLIPTVDGIGDWNYRWGILKGRAVALGGPAYQVAFVNVGQSNMDVLVDRRHNGSYGDGRTSLAFRVVDGLNFWFVAADGTSVNGQTIRWGYYSNGGRNDVSSASAPASAWQTLRVTVSSGNQITIYCDATQIAQFTSTQFSTGTRAGIFMDDFGSGFSGLARFDNFTVKSF